MTVGADLVPDPRVEPTISVERAGSILGLGRSKAYEEARRFLDTAGADGLPVIAFGRSLRVPTARLLALLGLDTPAEPGGADDVAPLRAVEGGGR